MGGGLISGGHAKISHNTNKMATHRNIFDKNCSSSYWAVPRGAALGLGSPKLNVDVNTPNGKAPMPKDMWKPSPNPKPGKPLVFSGSVRCPAGLGGTLFLGSSCLVLPLPYSGITLSLLMAALHTGHTCRLGRVSSHWCKHGQQNRWPHMLTTASRAVSKQMLHSNIRSSCLSSSPPASPPGADALARASLVSAIALTLLNLNKYPAFSHRKL